LEEVDQHNLQEQEMMELHQYFQLLQVQEVVEVEVGVRLLVLVLELEREEVAVRVAVEVGRAGSPAS
jgi:hypothetical protein